MRWLSVILRVLIVVGGIARVGLLIGVILLLMVRVRIVRVGGSTLAIVLAHDLYLRLRRAKTEIYRLEPAPMNRELC